MPTIPHRPQPPGCPACADPVAVVLRPEHQVRPLGGTVALFRCPACGTLILDDITGWKGSGIVFRATEADVEAYLVDRGLPVPKPLLEDP